MMAADYLRMSAAKVGAMELPFRTSRKRKFPRPFWWWEAASQE